MSAALPILYSFRRCPYAMRGRMALKVAGIHLEHRETLLRDKPPSMLEASPKGTVPVVVLPDGAVIEESLDVMRWALSQQDPQNWLSPGSTMFDLIAENDGPFKHHLDRYKYPNRYDDVDAIAHRTAGRSFLETLDQRLSEQAQLFGDTISLADIAIFPFIRQFANHDRDWFDAQDLPNLQTWLAGHLESALFADIMVKHELWVDPAGPSGD
ncbi:glutathione S-transferase [Hyphobacterium sp.]|uniref:glutathione S-transferase n=1 Tax=Hyphobacterium sp. TaxID=2004662 RepID=UPI0037478382